MRGERAFFFFFSLLFSFLGGLVGVLVRFWKMVCWGRREVLFLGWKNKDW